MQKTYKVLKYTEGYRRLWSLEMQNFCGWGKKILQKY